MAVHTINLRTEADRIRAANWLARVPIGWLISFTESKRTALQNKKMWAMLNDITASEMCGRKETPDNWKAICMNACGWEILFLEGMDGRPFPAGFRSSRMTRKQMGNLIDYMQAVGDENGVQWKERLEFD
jgi:hypothetical protein